MAFCSKCGVQLGESDSFCRSCGAPANVSVESTPQATVQPAQQAPFQSTIQQPVGQAPPKKYGVIVWLIPLLLLLMFSCCCIGSFFLLSMAGAEGQPSTVIPPSLPSESKTGSSGTSVSIPKNLTASSADNEINLNWNSVSASDLKGYKIYKSLTPGGDFVLIKNISSDKTGLSDVDVKKGVPYYYVVTALTVDEAESGNSNQASAMIEAPSLIPEGIYSWAAVQKRCKEDPKYLDLLERVTGLTMTDVDRLAQKEKDGLNLKKTLVKSTIITNSTKNYKILPNYVLKTDRIALTDENGMPQVLVKCGNPMKLQIPVTTTGVIIQQVQIFITNIIMVLPPAIVNIFINASQPVNSMTVLVLPGGIQTVLGPGFAPPPPGVFIDPADFGSDAAYDEDELEIRPLDGHDEGEETPTEEEPDAEPHDEEEELPEGQQWIEEGKLLVIADPSDPAPGQSVTMTVRLTPAKPGVEISYEVTGTDGYHSSGTVATDQNGEIKFTIPGGAGGVTDTIQVNVPSENLNGSAQYVF